MSKTDSKSSTCWDPAEMRAAIAVYRSTGDPAQVVGLAVADGDNDLLLALQSALALARTRDERDALEDIAFAEAEGFEVVGAAFMRRVEEQTVQSYGPHVGKFIDVGAFARGIIAVYGGEPPIEAVVASIGIEAERKVSDSMPVGPNEIGELVGRFATACQDCGGAEGGRGAHYCPACLDKARGLFRDGTCSVRGGSTASLDELARQLVSVKPELFTSCRRCRAKSCRPCSCATEVQVPARPRDGEIVCGRYRASGKEQWVTLRLREMS